MFPLLPFLPRVDPWRLLTATLVVSAPNLWYIYAILDRIQYHVPPGQIG